MQRLASIILVLGWIGLAAPAHAGCDPADARVAGSAFIYDGAIGGQPARLALIFHKDGSVEGRIAHASSTPDTVIRGTLEPGGERLKLTELDKTGLRRAEFAGEFKDPVLKQVPADPNSSALRAIRSCLQLDGVRRPVAGVSSEKLDFMNSRTVRLSQLGHLYAIAGVADDEVIDRSAKAFRQAMIDRDPVEVARHLHLPMVFNIKGKLVQVRNDRDLATHFDEIFESRVRAQIAGALPSMMRATEAGIMLTSTIWLDSEGFVIAF